MYLLFKYKHMPGTVMICYKHVAYVSNTPMWTYNRYCDDLLQTHNVYVQYSNMNIYHDMWWFIYYKNTAYVMYMSNIPIWTYTRCCDDLLETHTVNVQYSIWTYTRYCDDLLETHTVNVQYSNMNIYQVLWWCTRNTYRKWPIFRYEHIPGTVMIY